MKTKRLSIAIIIASLMLILASCASNAPRNVNYKPHRGRCGSCTKWTQNTPSADTKTFDLAFADQ